MCKGDDDRRADFRVSRSVAWLTADTLAQPICLWTFAAWPETITPMTTAITVYVTRLPHGEGLSLPAAQSDGAAGLDLSAAVAMTIMLAPGDRALIPTGLAIALPIGYEGQLRPRSGLAAKHGVTVLNAPGTVDSDYRGEVKVLLINHGSEPFAVERGMRIAQLVVAPVSNVALVEVGMLESTGRNTGGFGSTGISE